MKPPLQTATNAMNLFFTAKANALAMERLFTRDTVDYTLSTPFYFLAGFALELSFKSIIIATGGTEIQIRKIGHHLGKGYMAALECGYKPTDNEPLDRVVAIMEPLHRDMLLRYIPANLETIEIPVPSLIMQILGKHINDTEDQFSVWKC